MKRSSTKTPIKKQKSVVILDDNTVKHTHGYEISQKLQSDC